MKSYAGTKTTSGPNNIFVINDGVKTLLDPRPSQLIYNHSPDGFNWGHAGSGPAQTALAILLDCLGEKLAKCFYQQFKWAKVCTWGNTFCISCGEVKEWFKQNQI